MHERRVVNCDGRAETPEVVLALACLVSWLTAYALNRKTIVCDFLHLLVYPDGRLRATCGGSNA